MVVILRLFIESFCDDFEHKTQYACKHRMCERHGCMELRGKRSSAESLMSFAEVGLAPKKKKKGTSFQTISGTHRVCLEVALFRFSLILC